ncbi:MAG: cysteine desulfurase family protein [Pirellulales bacterium]
MPNMDDAIYLDNNSTAPIDPRVAEAMRACHLGRPANPASQHAAGRAARRLVEQAREQIAATVGAQTTGMDADRLVFTSGATEANNWIVRMLCGEPPGEIVISAIEHPSVEDVARQLALRGHQVHRIPVDANGVLNLSAAEQLISPETKVVSVMLGNNETGVLQPLAELAAICRAAGAPLHTDAVQVVGKLPVDFRGLGVDAMTFNAHKCHGPRGIGALLLRPELKLAPLLAGGFQQGGLRAGTESVALPVGFARCLAIWSKEGDARAEHLAALRDRLESQLRAEFAELVVNGGQAERLPQTSNVSFPGVDRQALVMALDLAGVACSTGSACASGSSEPSSVLIAMGCSPAVLEGSIRLSLGGFTTAAEVDQAVQRICRCVNDLRRQKSERKRAAPPPPRGAERL